MRWFFIRLPYAAGGIAVNTRGRVAVAPPIFRWMIGKDGPTVRAWIARKHGTIEQLADEASTNEGPGAGQEGAGR